MFGRDGGLRWGEGRGGGSGSASKQVFNTEDTEDHGGARRLKKWRIARGVFECCGWRGSDGAGGLQKDTSRRLAAGRGWGGRDAGEAGGCAATVQRQGARATGAWSVGYAATNGAALIWCGFLGNLGSWR